MAAEEWINKKGADLHLAAIDGSRHEPEPEGWWKGGEMNTTPGILDSPNRYEIRIYYTSCKYWGWDMLTSILIHEFGHALLSMNTVKRGGDVDEEGQANACGHDNMPPELIPEQYWLYREFCAQTYLALGAYTEDRLRHELNDRRQ